MDTNGKALKGNKVHVSTAYSDNLVCKKNKECIVYSNFLSMILLSFDKIYFTIMIKKNKQFWRVFTVKKRGEKILEIIHNKKRE